MFSPGDVVEMFSPVAGKKKYHLCLCISEGTGVHNFLFLNSNSGFKGDYILDDGIVPGLPESPTGETIVSFSQVVRMNLNRLTMYKAKRLNCISADLAGELLHFARTTPALSDIDKKLVVRALELLSNS